MILGRALLLIASLASSDPLDPAREAFERGDHVQAQRLALEQAQVPHAGAALYLAGLARFRSGDAAGALEALEQAARAEDAPTGGQWDYNLGACLYALGRFAEAESAFEAAAGADPSLAATALANAGFAALDAGERERAEAHARRARAAARGRELDLVGDLEAALAGAQAEARQEERRRAEQEYQEGLSAYDAHRYDEARRHFLASALASPSGRAWIMSGASALKLGERGIARDELSKALVLPLDEAERRTARAYLDVLGPGLRSRGAGWEVSVQAGSGFDSNVLQSGTTGAGNYLPLAAGVEQSALASAAAAVAWRGAPAARLWAEATWGFDELAYLSDTVSDYSLQQHMLSGALELALGPARFGAATSGQLVFTGLSDFRGMLGAVEAGGYLALDEGAWTSTRLDGSWTRKLSLGSEFDYLQGHRVDAVLSQQLRLGRLSADVSLRWRDERMGTLLLENSLGQDLAVVCPGPCPNQYVIPLSYRGTSLGLSLRGTPVPRLRLGLGLGWELRGFTDDSRVVVLLPNEVQVTVDRRRREDSRAFASAWAGVRVWRGLELAARYDLVVNRSNIDTGAANAAGACVAPGYSCHQFDYDDNNYEKHVVTLETSWSW